MIVMSKTKIINDFTDYEVSEDGKIFSLKNNLRKELKHQMSNAGYFFIGLCKNGKVKNKFIHRLVAQAFIENPLNKEQVNHIDGNKLNNHFSNLEWVTPSENIIHAQNSGLLKRSYIQNNNLGMRSRKKTMDTTTGIIYDSLKEACNMTNQNYNVVLQKFKRKSSTNRFKYI